MQMKSLLLGAVGAAALFASPAMAANCEVTHWWTSGGESAAVKVFADAFDALPGGDKWVDGAIGGSGDTARPIIISRVQGGNPPCATQFNPGHDSDELVAAGLMQDLTDLATKEDWKKLVRPASQLEGCTKEGKVYCVPVNLHSAQWMWTNRKVFTDAGLPQPKNLTELIADAPKLKEKGIMPLSLAQGWPVGLMINDVTVGIGGLDLYLKIYKDRDIAAATGPESQKVWKVLDDLRHLIDPKAMVPQWNDAVSQVITGKAAANIMGDWARGEFSVAKMVAGKDYDCLPGLGFAQLLDTGGDQFFFPKSKDPAITAEQMKMASMMISKPVQVAFNLKKGSLPIRADVDLAAADDCMKKGLKILEDPKNILPSDRQMMQADSINQINDVRNEFFTNMKMTPDDAMKKIADILKNAPK